MSTMIRAGFDGPFGAPQPSLSSVPVQRDRSNVPSESFAERQIVHFAMVLGRKWACPHPGHEMCFTGAGRHVRLTDDHIMKWVTALCNGEATAVSPPFALGENASDVPLPGSLDEPPRYSYVSATPPTHPAAGSSYPNSNNTHPSHQIMPLPPILESEGFSLAERNPISIQQSTAAAVPRPLRNETKSQQHSPKSPYPLILQRPSSPLTRSKSTFSASSFTTVATSPEESQCGSVDTELTASTVATDQRANPMLLDSMLSVLESRSQEQPLKTGTQTPNAEPSEDSIPVRERASVSTSAQKSRSTYPSSTPSSPSVHSGSHFGATDASYSQPQMRPDHISNQNAMSSPAQTLLHDLSLQSDQQQMEAVRYPQTQTYPQNQSQSQPSPPSVSQSLTPLVVLSSPSAGVSTAQNSQYRNPNTDSQQSQQSSASSAPVHATSTDLLAPRQTHNPRQTSVSSYTTINSVISNATTNTFLTNTTDSSGQLLTITAFPDPPAHTPTTGRSGSFPGSLARGGGEPNQPHSLPSQAQGGVQAQERSQGQGQAESREEEWDHEHQSLTEQWREGVVYQMSQNQSQISYADTAISGSPFSHLSTLDEDAPPIREAHFSPRSTGTESVSSYESSGSRTPSSGISVLVLSQSPPTNPTLTLSPGRPRSANTQINSPRGTSTTTKQPPAKIRKDVVVIPLAPSPKIEFPLSSRYFWEGTTGPGLALAEQFRLDVAARRKAAEAALLRSANGGKGTLKGKEKEGLTQTTHSVFKNTNIVASVHTRVTSMSDSMPSGKRSSSSDGYYSTTVPEEAGSGGGNIGRTMGSSSGSTSSIPRSFMSNLNTAPMLNAALSASHPSLLISTPTRPLLAYGPSNAANPSNFNLNSTTTLHYTHPSPYAASEHERTGADTPHLSSYDGSMTDLVRGGRSVWSPYTTFLPSMSTSPPPPESLRSKWMESAALSKRAKAHLARLKKWMKRANDVVVMGKKAKGKEGECVSELEREGVVQMMGDAIEMARGSYPIKIHKFAYEIGRELQRWLQVFTESDPELLKNPQNVTIAIIVQACIIPILLIRISEVDQSVLPLATDLINAMTKVPLVLHDNEVPLFHTPPVLPVRQRSATNKKTPTLDLVSSSRGAASTASLAIHLVSRELGLMKPTCESQHSWLGLYLLRIVEWTMTLRELSRGEVDAMRGMVRRREMEYNIPDTKSNSNGSMSSRPWEVALFALCASQTPVFKNAVLGPIGLPHLVSGLDAMLDMNIDMDGVKWEDVALTLRAMAFLSEHRWVVDGVEKECEVLITSIMGVFRRTIPSRWFSIRFWAMDTIRNLVSHRPPLVRILVSQDVASAFATLTPTSPSYPQLIGTRAPVNAQAKSRPRIMDEYRKEAAKRAEEMVSYIKNWTDWQPYLRTLAPVSLGLVGNGTSGF